MQIIIDFLELFREIWALGVGGTSFGNIFFSIAIFILFILIRGLLSNFIINKIKRFVQKSSNQFDNALLDSLEGPTKFFPVVIGFFAATQFISADEKLYAFLNTINKSLVTILIFWLIHQLILPLSYLIKKVEDLLSKDLLNWIISALKILVIIIGLSSVLELWGIKIGPIIAGLGLFGVAVALGAQDLFKNLISGILVLIEKRFKVGDVIKVESVIEGVVEKIGFRSTSIRKFDKALCTIPNFQFAENPVINISEISNRRINWIVGLEYGSSVKQLKKVRDEIENYIKKNDSFHVSESTPVIVRVDKLSESSIDILVRCFTKTNQYQEWLQVKDALALAIKEIVESNNAGFAFPSQSLYIEKK